MKKDKLITAVLVLVLVAGLSLLLYPTVSDWWNAVHQSYAVNDYNSKVIAMDTSAYEKLLTEAEAYNLTLLGRDNDRFGMTDEEREEYEKILDVSGTGIMATMEIPKLDVKFPIYHGTSEGVLRIAVGHVEGSSLPVGGKGTHCALSGHRGLPSARLFTDLDKMEVGDSFRIRTLYETLTYEVDQITTVLPYEMDDLAIDENEDYCTLVTCTPYGINTHRLLVRGRRVENDPALETQPAEEAPVQNPNPRRSLEMDTLTHLLVVMLALAVLLAVILIATLITDRKKKK